MKVATHYLNFILPPGGACNQTVPESSTKSTKPLMELQQWGLTSCFSPKLPLDVPHPSFFPSMSTLSDPGSYRSTCHLACSAVSSSRKLPPSLLPSMLSLCLAPQAPGVFLLYLAIYDMINSHRL